jgi:superfamily II DNA helicase RecQ
MDWTIENSQGNHLQKEVRMDQNLFCTGKRDIHIEFSLFVQRLREMLRHMIQFCENKIDCRRVQMLAVSFCDKACTNKKVHHMISV